MSTLTVEQREFIIKEYDYQRNFKKKNYQQIKDDFGCKYHISISSDFIYNLCNRRRNTKKQDISIKSESKPDKSVAKLSDFLKEKNITIKELEKIFYQKTIEDTKTFKIDDGKEVFKIGVIGDTHLGAKSCALEELHKIYEMFAEKGITDVLHAGDLCDGGGKVYSGHLGELKVFGFDDMVEYVAENYPLMSGITTHFINGNHDEDFLKNGGADIGNAISKKRKDLHYLGWYDANIIINGIIIGLHHGAGGGAYAQSYKLQQYIKDLTGDMKPQLYILGHYHTTFYGSFRNIHCYTPGCFQKPNNFSVRLKLPNTVGGWILEIHKTKKNEIRSIKSEFIQFYF